MLKDQEAQMQIKYRIEFKLVKFLEVRRKKFEMLKDYY